MTRLRIQSLDLLRGFAVLGILLMNITDFSQAGNAYLNPNLGAGLGGYNKFFWNFNWLFADMKFMSLFSILFGAGIVLFADNVNSKGLIPWKWQYRRLFFLFLFGLIHAYFIWSGDILVAYSICGSLVFLLRKLKLRTLGIIGVILFSVPIILSLSLYHFTPNLDLQEYFIFWDTPKGEIEDQVNAFVSSYGAQLPYRIKSALQIQTLIFIFESFWRISALMILGMILYRTNIITAKKNKSFYKKSASVSLVLGLLISGIGLYYGYQYNWTSIYTIILGRLSNYISSIPIALGYLSLIMLWTQSKKFPQLQHHLKMTGRMAFTNYIAMSVICSLIFYTFKLYNQVDRLEQFLIVLAIWIIMLLISPIVLKRYQYGPLEWFWRKLTYWNMKQKS